MRTCNNNGKAYHKNTHIEALMIQLLGQS